MGRNDLEDALTKLDIFSQEEAQMADSQTLRITHSVHDEVKLVDAKSGMRGGHGWQSGEDGPSDYFDYYALQLFAKS